MGALPPYPPSGLCPWTPAGGTALRSPFFPPTLSDLPPPMCVCSDNNFRTTRLSYRRGTARLAVSVDILSSTANCTKIAFSKACIRCMTLKVTQGHRNCRCSIVYVSIPVSGIHVIRTYLSCTVSRILTLTSYITAFDLEKSFSFNKTGHVHAPIHV